MESIKLMTFQNIQVEYKLAGMGNRILGRLIDNVIRFAYLILIVLIISQINKGSDINTGSVHKNGASEILGYFMIFLLSVPFVFYSLIFEIFMNGQSPGKRSFKMKVASLDGKPVTVWQYILRWMFLIIDNTTIGLIPMALSKADQRIGDLLAGTSVVSLEEPREDIFSGITFPENYSPVFPEAHNLSDKDISLLKEVVYKAHFDNQVSSQIIEKAANKTRELLNIQSQSDNLNFLQQIVKDYIFLYGREN